MGRGEFVPFGHDGGIARDWKLHWHVLTVLSGVVVHRRVTSSVTFAGTNNPRERFILFSGKLFFLSSRTVRWENLMFEVPQFPVFWGKLFLVVRVVLRGSRNSCANSDRNMWFTIQSIPNFKLTKYACFLQASNPSNTWPQLTSYVRDRSKGSLRKLSSYSLLNSIYLTDQLCHSLVVNPLLRKILDP